MKRGLMLVCAVALCFAYADPPIPEVMGHNLNDTFLNSLMNKPQNWELTFDNPANFSATLIGVFPSVEDRIPTNPNPYNHTILWSWSEDYLTDISNSTCEFSLENKTYYFQILVNNISSAPYDNPPSEISAFAFPVSSTELEEFNA
ncbi:MAG TPA: hypothetical protein PKJ97_01295, partial [Candidatus Bilamarchaeaceae archaeon]|nr:hypothetical protein [Candidatus Bilamarchaeaceae archaeon]